MGVVPITESLAIHRFVPPTDRTGLCAYPSCGLPESVVRHFRFGPEEITPLCVITVDESLTRRRRPFRFRVARIEQVGTGNDLFYVYGQRLTLHGGPSRRNVPVHVMRAREVIGIEPGPDGAMWLEDMPAGTRLDAGPYQTYVKAADGSWGRPWCAPSLRGALVWRLYGTGEARITLPDALPERFRKTRERYDWPAAPLLDTGGYLSCGCHGTQSDHTCAD